MIDPEEFLSRLQKSKDLEREFWCLSLEILCDLGYDEGVRFYTEGKMTDKQVKEILEKLRERRALLSERQEALLRQVLSANFCQGELSCKDKD